MTFCLGCKRNAAGGYEVMNYEEWPADCLRFIDPGEQTERDVFPCILERSDNSAQQIGHVCQTIQVYHTIHQRGIVPVPDPVHDVAISWDAEDAYQDDG